MVTLHILRCLISDELQHQDDCVKLLGESFPHVHRWLDEPFEHEGAIHRRVRHHRQGIERVRSLFGHRATLAAKIHVLRDCQGIPEKKDYDSGLVDPLGFPLSRTIQQIVTYSDEDFYKVALDLIDDEHTCLLLPGWLDGVPEFVALINRVIGALQPEKRASILANWSSVRDAVGRLTELSSRYAVLGSEPQFESLSSENAESLGDPGKALLANLRSQLGSVDFGWIAATALINPLQLIDLDYVTHLAQDLPERPTERDMMMFAAPEKLNIQARTFSDAKSATVITRFQELHLSAVESHLESEVGIEIKFRIHPLPQYILVIENNGRYYLRAGMHRAFVLARSGMSRIPCFLARNVEMPAIVGPYPLYPPRVLQLPRPPMLLDALDPSLTVKSDYPQTRRLLRIAAEEIAIPFN